MQKWNDESLLEVVEELAIWEGMISSEEELSERFDEFLMEVNCCPERMTATDVRVTFNDWKDSMGKDGMIHPEQCNEYCYEGKYNGN